MWFLKRLNASPLESWFYNQDFKKYLNLTVFQSTSLKVTEVLSAGHNILQTLQSKSQEEKAVHVFNNLVNMPLWKDADIDKSSIVTEIINEMDAHLIQQAIGVGTNNDITKGTTTITDSGEKLLILTIVLNLAHQPTLLNIYLILLCPRWILR